VAVKGAVVCDAVYSHISSLTFRRNKKTSFVALPHKLCRPSDRRFAAKFVPNFADRGCRVVSATDPHGRILGFIDRSRCCLFQVAPQLYSWGWVDFRRKCCYIVTLTARSLLDLTLKIEAVCSSETSVNMYRTARLYISEGTSHSSWKYFSRPNVVIEILILYSVCQTALCVCVRARARACTHVFWVSKQFVLRKVLIFLCLLKINLSKCFFLDHLEFTKEQPVVHPENMHFSLKTGNCSRGILVRMCNYHPVIWEVSLGLFVSEELFWCSWVLSSYGWEMFSLSKLSLYCSFLNIFNGNCNVKCITCNVILQYNYVELCNCTLTESNNNCFWFWRMLAWECILEDTSQAEEGWFSWWRRCGKIETGCLCNHFPFNCCK
jgi:hypothetical protein